MHYRISFIFITFVCLCSFATTGFAQNANTDEDSKPVILYSGTPKKYEIADIKVEGVKNYEDYVLIGLSGLSVGQTITVPGDEITGAIKRYWRHGLFSNVQITAEKIEGDKIWLKISLTQRPRIADVRYHGVKKSERTDLESKLGMVKGMQITPNTVDRAKTLIKRYFDDKGFKNAEVIISQKDDPSSENQVIVDIDIDKKEKIKVHEIQIVGNHAIKTSKLKKVMKKTNEKGKLRNLFRTKKFVPENFEADKQLIIDKYNELGYRDAMIVKDSVSQYDEKTVNVYLNIDEGQKYYLRNVTWVGNTLYPSEQLNFLLRMKKGDVYNQKLLNERVSTDDDAIGNLYYNNGYLFYNLDPVEVNIVGDSIDLEMRIYEGRQATINKIKISGNDRLYENVVRRELRIRPGQLFSKEDLMRSLREIQQMGHFDPEKLQPDIQPDPMNGTVDIGLPLTSKANDQVEFSAGWGQTGVIGKLSLKFTNFSMKNFLNPKTYKGIIPQGEGQTLTLSGQTNGRYYQAYSISFMDPWFGGKRPNTLSVSAYFSKQTDISSNYLTNSGYGYGYPGYGYGYPGYYGGGYGYGSNYYGNYGYNNSYEYAYDPDKSIMMFGLAAGYGKRLNWPDDYFQFMATLNYQLYMMHDWDYFLVNNGNCHNINLELMLQRNSIDNPLYTRKGSQFMLSVAATPPYSLFDGKDYASMSSSDPDKYKFIEYHKWKFKAKIFSPLAPLTVKRTPVLMTRVEYGFLGTYNKNKKSPFETFYMGGDGMSGYSSTYAQETIGLRGYENGSIAGNGGYNSYGYAYSRLAMELRYPFLLEPSSTIYGLVFVEAGNAWTDLKNFNPFNLKRSAGVGVRIFLPMIGLMGLDWAYGFDEPNYGSNGKRSGSNLHFIIGQEF